MRGAAVEGIVLRLKWRAFFRARNGARAWSRIRAAP